MRHAREDYNRFQDPAGIIPEDEPVFLLRGKDRAAPAAIRAWAKEACDIGADAGILIAALSWATEMECYQRKSGNSQIPDLPKGE